MRPARSVIGFLALLAVSAAGSACPRDSDHPAPSVADLEDPQCTLLEASYPTWLHPSMALAARSLEPPSTERAPGVDARWSLHVFEGEFLDQSSLVSRLRNWEGYEVLPVLTLVRTSGGAALFFGVDRDGIAGMHFRGGAGGLDMPRPVVAETRIVK